MTRKRSRHSKEQEAENDQEEEEDEEDEEDNDPGEDDDDDEDDPEQQEDDSDGDDSHSDSDDNSRALRGKKTAQLIGKLLEHWGTNACKIERLNRKRKHAGATTMATTTSTEASISKTSMITVQNVMSMLSDHEVERNANVEQWWKKVKKLVISALKKLGSSDCSGINALISLLNGIHPPIFIDKPSAHSQKPLPDAQRCIALCADKTRCPKQRNRNHAFLCTMHASHNPFGIDSQYIEEVREKKATIPVQLRLVLYRGINYYVDTVNNNVYNTDDIFNNSPRPRIIGTYVSRTTDAGEEKYTIPELDAPQPLSPLGVS